MHYWIKCKMGFGWWSATGRRQRADNRGQKIGGLIARRLESYKVWKRQKKKLNAQKGTK
jgi:hypothetical protein